MHEAGPHLQPRPHRTLLYVLSVDAPLHHRYRCMQRTILAALGLQRGFLQVDMLRSIRLWYVFDRAAPTSDDLRLEQRRGDVLRLDAGATCLGKVIAAIQHAATRRFEAMVLSDDDAFIHPQRLALDIAEWGWNPNLVYGILSWAAGWDERRMQHYGYGNTPDVVVGRLMQEWQLRRSVDAPATRQGPFAFPLGFCMGLGSAIVAAIVAQLTTEPRLIRLQKFLGASRATRKCMPATDGGLGYILVSLSPATPIAYVDISSTARVHFWRSRSSEKFLRAGNLVIMHGAKDWADHFAWAACVVRELPSGMLERSRGHTCTANNVGLDFECRRTEDTWRACAQAGLLARVAGSADRAAARVGVAGSPHPAQGPRQKAHREVATRNASVVWCRVSMSASDERARPNVVPGGVGYTRSVCNNASEPTQCAAEKAEPHRAGRFVQRRD